VARTIHFFEYFRATESQEAAASVYTALRIESTQED